MQLKTIPATENTEMHRGEKNQASPFWKRSIGRFTRAALVACLLVGLTGSMAMAQATATAVANEPLESATSAPASAPASMPATQGATRPAVKSYVLGSLKPLAKGEKGYVFQVQFTPEGGIANLSLADYYKTAEDKRRHDGGHYELLAPVTRGDGSELMPYQTDFRVTIGDRNYDLKGVNAVDVKMTQSDPDTQTITFTWKPYLKEPSAPIAVITKEYAIRKGDYSIGMTLKARNLWNAPIKVGAIQTGPAGLRREDIRTEDRRLAYAVLPENKDIQVKFESGDARFKGGLEVGSSRGTDKLQPIVWMGAANKFFESIIYVKADGDRLIPAQPVIQYNAPTVPAGSDHIAVPELAVESLKVEPGQAVTLAAMDIFAGPKNRSLFETTPLYKRLNYTQSIELSSGCPCSFGWLSYLLIAFLELLAKSVALGNYGVAIIILVIIVRLLLHPLTKKGQVSMMKMQKLAPKMAELREKYKDDKDTLNREMMKFYREQGATPILGCLPMLLQMPIWIALWTALNVDVALRQAGFLPVWITDLAAPDALVHFGSVIFVPLIGGLIGPITSFNLLPLLLTVAMYYQTKLTPTPSTAATPEQLKQQQMQQKMMRYMMPVMMLLFFYNAPSGLNLYIMTSTFSSVIEQIVIRRHIQQREALEAMRETRVDLPGKVARGSRTKKPKGPFWFRHG